jgi:heme exporter protein D
MTRTVRTGAGILSWLAFFTIFFLRLDYDNIFDPAIGALALLFAGGVAALLWLAAYILGDILVKGVVEDIDEEKIDVLEDGLLQRVREAKLRARMDPENPEVVTIVPGHPGKVQPETK